MIEILKPLLMKYVVVYFDDLLKFSKSKEEHLQYLPVVFQILEQHQLSLNLKKMLFSYIRSPFPGIHHGGIRS